MLSKLIVFLLLLSGISSFAQSSLHIHGPAPENFVLNKRIKSKYTSDISDPSGKMNLMKQYLLYIQQNLQERGFTVMNNAESGSSSLSKQRCFIDVIRYDTTGGKINFTENKQLKKKCSYLSNASAPAQIQGDFMIRINRIEFESSRLPSLLNYKNTSMIVHYDVFDRSGKKVLGQKHCASFHTSSKMMSSALYPALEDAADQLTLNVLGLIFNRTY